MFKVKAPEAQKVQIDLGKNMTSKKTQMAFGQELRIHKAKFSLLFFID
jgi:hypothetical protein